VKENYEKICTFFFAGSLSLSATTVTVYNGWNLLGYSTEVDLNATFSPYPDITLIWSFDNDKKSWEAYGNTENYRNLVKSNGYNSIEKIGNGLGYWVMNSGSDLRIKIIDFGLPPVAPEPDENLTENNSLEENISETNTSNSRVLKTGQTESISDFDDGYYQKGLDRKY